MGGHNQIHALVDGSRLRSYRLSPPWVVWQGEPDEHRPARERSEGDDEPGCFSTIRASLSGIPTAGWGVTVGMLICLMLKTNILALFVICPSMPILGKQVTCDDVVVGLEETVDMGSGKPRRFATAGPGPNLFREIWKNETHVFAAEGGPTRHNSLTLELGHPE